HLLGVVARGARVPERERGDPVGVDVLGGAFELGERGDGGPRGGGVRVVDLEQQRLVGLDDQRPVGHDPWYSLQANGAPRDATQRDAYVRSGERIGDGHLDEWGPPELGLYFPGSVRERTNATAIIPGPGGQRPSPEGACRIGARTKASRNTRPVRPRPKARRIVPMLKPPGQDTRTRPPTAHRALFVRPALAESGAHVPECGRSSPAILRGTLT